MASRAAATIPEAHQVLIEAFAVNERMNRTLLEHRDRRLWQSEPPGGNGRALGRFSLTSATFAANG